MGYLTQYGPFYPVNGWSNGICILLNLDSHVHARRAMSGVANTMARVTRAIPVILLIVVFLSASVACATMTPAPTAPAHPCCPKPGHPNSDPCSKSGCISAVPVLPPALVFSTIELPVAAISVEDPSKEGFLPALTVVDGLRSAPFDLFLTNHQLLI